jgi:hypothetical protein
MLNVEETFQNAFQFEVEKVNNFYVSQVWLVYDSSLMF